MSSPPSLVRRAVRRLNRQSAAAVLQRLPGSSSSSSCFHCSSRSGLLCATLRAYSTSASSPSPSLPSSFQALDDAVRNILAASTSSVGLLLPAITAKLPDDIHDELAERNMSLLQYLQSKPETFAVQRSDQNIWKVRLTAGNPTAAPRGRGGGSGINPVVSSTATRTSSSSSASPVQRRVVYAKDVSYTSINQPSFTAYLGKTFFLHNWLLSHTTVHRLSSIQGLFANMPNDCQQAAENFGGLRSYLRTRMKTIYRYPDDRNLIAIEPTPRDQYEEMLSRYKSGELDENDHPSAWAMCALALPWVGINDVTDLFLNRISAVQCMQRIPHVADIPPAPSHFDFRGSTSSGVIKPKKDVARFNDLLSTQMLIPLIPSYFIPLPDAVQHLPGYTEQHIVSYFSMQHGVQLVSLPNRRTFIRIHGHTVKLDMTESTAACTLHPNYEVSGKLGKEIHAALRDIHGKWTKLPELMAKVPAELREQLPPFEGEEVIMFFSQLLHLFRFNPSNLVVMPLAEKDAYPNDLTYHNSPCPRMLAWMVSALSDGPLTLEGVEANADPEELEHTLDFFPDLATFVRCHRLVLDLDEETKTVMTMYYKHKQEVGNLSLEEKLQQALAKGDKHQRRRIMRKMESQRNPENPFFDKKNLADYLYNMLPADKPVSYSMFLRKIPWEIVGCLPNKQLAFFKKHAAHFVVFEMNGANQLWIARSGVEIPEHALQTEFDDDELVAIVTGVVKNRPPHAPIAVDKIGFHIPAGARDSIKNRYGGMLQFLKSYPEDYALVVRGEQIEMDTTVTALR